MEQAVRNVNVRLAEQIVGENALNQSYIDQLLIQEDGTDNKSSLGANATLGVSLAVARAAAKALRLPLYQYLGGVHAVRMPVPMMNILNGGAPRGQYGRSSGVHDHAGGSGSFREAGTHGAEIYQR